MYKEGKPLVTVIIPTYKRLKKLKRAVKSVYNQIYDNIELIIVNDDPKIDIENFLSLKNKIIIINHKKNQGGAAARNSGIERASGKYIAFLDDDDIFIKNKIEKSVKLMENLNSEWIGIYSWWIKKDNRKLIKSFIEGDLSLALLTFNRKLNLGGTTSLFLRSDIVKSIGGFDNSYIRHQDWEFLLRICRKGKIKLLKEPLFIKGNSNATPPPEIHLKLKFKFLKDFSNLIMSYGNNVSKKIYCTQFIVVAFQFLKEGELIKSLYIFYRIFKYGPKIFIYSFLNLLLYYSFLI